MDFQDTGHLTLKEQGERAIPYLAAHSGAYVWVIVQGDHQDESKEQFVVRDVLEKTGLTCRIIAGLPDRNRTIYLMQAIKPSQASTDDSVSWFSFNAKDATFAITTSKQGQDHESAILTAVEALLYQMRAGS